MAVPDPVTGPLVGLRPYRCADSWITRSGPALGADTDAVLAALGYGPEAIARLRADGAVA